MSCSSWKSIGQNEVDCARVVQTHLNKRGGAVADDVTEKNLRELAFDTQRYSGAAIANLVNLAAMRAERDTRDQIRYQDLTDVGHSHEASFLRVLPCHTCLAHPRHYRAVCTCPSGNTRID